MCGVPKHLLFSQYDLFGIAWANSWSNEPDTLMRLDSPAV